MSEAHQKRPALSVLERVLRLRKRMAGREDGLLPGDKAGWSDETPDPTSLWARFVESDEREIQVMSLIQWNTYDDFSEWDKRI